MTPKKNIPLKPAELLENRDYYIENGYWVFTEYYHKARGYCCGSGCRHCPYTASKKKTEAPKL